MSYWRILYWSLLNWQNLRLRCGCIAVPVNWFFGIISSCFAKFKKSVHSLEPGETPSYSKLCTTFLNFAKNDEIMSKNHFTGTATQPQCNRKFCQFNKDQYCISCLIKTLASDLFFTSLHKRDFPRWRHIYASIIFVCVPFYYNIVQYWF